jgi:hypothetical protein
MIKPLARTFDFKHLIKIQMMVKPFARTLRIVTKLTD